MERPQSAPAPEQSCFPHWMLLAPGACLHRLPFGWGWLGGGACLGGGLRRSGGLMQRMRGHRAGDAGDGTGPDQ